MYTNKIMVGCTVLGCKSHSDRKIDGITFHTYKTDAELKKIWVRATGRRNWVPNKYARMCSVHFSKDDFIRQGERMQLKPFSVPTKNVNFEQGDELKIMASPDKDSADMKAMDTPVDSSRPSKDLRECRTCLEGIRTKRDCFNLYEPWRTPSEDLAATVAEDLNRLANIQVNKTDNLSKVICRKCYEKIKMASLFVRFVQKKDDELKKRLGQVVDISSETVWPQPIQHKSLVEMDVEVKQEMISDEESEDPPAKDTDYPFVEVKVEPEEIVAQNNQSQGNGPEEKLNFGEIILTNGDSCDFEEEEFLDLSVKDEPLSDEDCQMDLPLECLLCTKTFHRLSGLKAHVIAQHSYSSVSRRPRGHVCATCRRSFTTSTDLMVHSTCHSEVSCYSCNSSFKSFDLLTKHRNRCKVSKTGDMKKLKTLDDVMRPTKDSKTDDSLRSTNLKCPHCDEMFPEEYYMNIHMLVQHSTANDASQQFQTELANELDETNNQNENMKYSNDHLTCLNDNANSADDIAMATEDVQQIIKNVEQINNIDDNENKVHIENINEMDMEIENKAHIEDMNKMDTEHENKAHIEDINEMDTSEGIASATGNNILDPSQVITSESANNLEDTIEGRASETENNTLDPSEVIVSETENNIEDTVDSENNVVITIEGRASETETNTVDPIEVIASESTNNIENTIETENNIVNTIQGIASEIANNMVDTSKSIVVAIEHNLVDTSDCIGGVIGNNVVDSSASVVDFMAERNLEDTSENVLGVPENIVDSTENDMKHDENLTENYIKLDEHLSDHFIKLEEEITKNDENEGDTNEDGKLDAIKEADIDFKIVEDSEMSEANVNLVESDFCLIDTVEPKVLSCVSDIPDVDIPNNSDLKTDCDLKTDLGDILGLHCDT